MASPRKFSEKIALHNQKQAEETAAFEQIMREVGSATRGTPVAPPAPHQKHHLHINQTLGAYRGGSLPNVNQFGNNTIDLQSALSSLEDMKQGKDALVDRVYRESRSRHIGPHRRQFDKRVDCSPYGSPYLSPPPDTSWRRTNSDSALHQSAMNPVDSYHGSTTPPANRRVLDAGMNAADSQQLKGYWDAKKQLIPPSHGRPKSCEVPGINIYPMEQDPNLMHISISNNTGSLPDLTNLQFQSPLSTPIDTEDQTGSSSSYNQTPLEQQQAQQQQQQQQAGALSPTSLSAALAVSRVASSTGPTSAQQQSQQVVQRRRAHHPMLTNLIISGTQQGVATDSYTPPPHSQQPSQPQSYHIYSQQQQQQSLSVSTNQDVTATSHMSYRSTSPADTSYSAPQSPVSQSLSPVSSPGLGPPSKDPFIEPGGGYYIHSNAQTNAMQERFQHFTMIDTPPASSAVNSIFLSDISNHLHYSQVSNMTGLVDGLDGSGGYYGTSLDQFTRSSQSGAMTSPVGGPQQNQPATPQTPQTPSSIPNIILTDFSTGSGVDPLDPMNRPDFVKDLGSAMAGISGPFEADLYVTDDLKEGLDPIDFDGLQMLTDPDMVTDPATEDSFRLDRL